MKTNQHFNLSKPSKKLIASASTKAERVILKAMLIDAEAIKKERMVMNYEVQPNGNRPKKKERIDPSQNKPLKVI